MDTTYHEALNDTSDVVLILDSLRDRDISLPLHELLDHLTLRLNRASLIMVDASTDENAAHAALAEITQVADALDQLFRNTEPCDAGVVIDDAACRLRRNVRALSELPANRGWRVEQTAEGFQASIIWRGFSLRSRKMPTEAAVIDWAKDAIRLLSRETVS